MAVGARRFCLASPPPPTSPSSPRPVLPTQPRPHLGPTASLTSPLSLAPLSRALHPLPRPSPSPVRISYSSNEASRRYLSTALRQEKDSLSRGHRYGTGLDLLSRSGAGMGGGAGGRPSSGGVSRLHLSAADQRALKDKVGGPGGGGVVAAAVSARPALPPPSTHHARTTPLRCSPPSRASSRTPL